MRYEFSVGSMPVDVFRYRLKQIHGTTEIEIYDRFANETVISNIYTEKELFNEHAENISTFDISFQYRDNLNEEYKEFIRELDLYIKRTVENIR